MSPSVRPSFDVVRVTIEPDYCWPHDRVTKHYVWDDGRRECADCLDTAPRPSAQLPKDAPAFLGLHATTPPHWEINWPAVAWWAAWFAGFGVWLLAGIGLASLLGWRP